MVDVGSSDSSGSQRMYSRIEMSHIEPDVCGLVCWVWVLFCYDQNGEVRGTWNNKGDQETMTLTLIPQPLNPLDDALFIQIEARPTN